MKRTATLLMAMAALGLMSCSKSGQQDGKEKGRNTRTPPAERLQKKASSYSGPKLSLPAKFTPGKYYSTESMDMSINMDMTDERSGQNQKIDTQMSVSIGADAEITPVDSSSGEQSIRFICRKAKTKVSVKAGANQKTLQYDSEGPEGRQDYELKRAIEPLLNAEFALFLKDGKFIRLDGIEMLIARVGSGPEGKQVSDMIEPMLKEMLEKHWGEAIPKMPVAPGDRWQGNIKLAPNPLLGELGFQFDCILQDFEDTPHGKVAVIDLAATVTAGEKPMKSNQFPAGTDVKLKDMLVDADGTARFDLDLGVTTSITMDMRGTFNMSVQAGREGGVVKVDLKAKFTGDWQRKGAAAESRRAAEP
jgi:hypothetical protein